MYIQHMQTSVCTLLYAPTHVHTDTIHMPHKQMYTYIYSYIFHRCAHQHMYPPHTSMYTPTQMCTTPLMNT